MMNKYTFKRPYKRSYHDITVTVYAKNIDEAKEKAQKLTEEDASYTTLLSIEEGLVEGVERQVNT